MVNIVVGGQMDKKSIARLIEDHGQGEVEISVKSDINAALDVKNGKAQYYLGSCATGAGGALGMAIGILGAKKTVSVSTPGKVFNDEEIKEAIEDGKVAFGFVNTDAKRIVPILMEEILRKNKEE